MAPAGEGIMGPGGADTEAGRGPGGADTEAGRGPGGADAEVITGPLEPWQAAEVADLVAKAAWVDGAKPLSDAALLSRSPSDVHLLWWGRPGAGGAGAPRSLVAYAHVDRASSTGEVAVAPVARRAGLGSAASRAALEAGAEQFWAHGNLPGARTLVRQLGLEPRRRLMVMARPLTPSDAQQPQWPPGYVMRSYEPGADDAGLLRVNAAAFADLPDQGGWTPEDLAERRRADWFSPADVLLLCEAPPTADPGGRGAIVGFHWTKRHSPEVGEVYVVGLDPSHQGRGLGRPLVQAGLGRLAGLGCVEAVLFVDESNAEAVRLYRRMGFARQRDDVLYGLAGGASGLAG